MPTITLTFTNEQLASIESARARANNQIADPTLRIPDAQSYVQKVADSAVESYAQMAADPVQRAQDEIARVQREAADAKAASDERERLASEQLAAVQAELASLREN